MEETFPEYFVLLSLYFVKSSQLRALKFLYLKTRYVNLTFAILRQK